MENAVVFENVVKTYDNKPALNNLSCNFSGNKVTGLLGPNGAGKSTLLKMIVGLVKPNSGRVQVWGQQPGIRANADIAYLPDRGSWYGFQSVQNAIDYAGKILPGFDNAKAWELCKSMKLDPGVKVGSMSKGQQACLNLLLCLARDVKLILLDEPFSGIDLISRERIISGIIDSIADSKKTIILSTHEIYESESLFEDVLFLDGGSTMLSGDVEALRAKEGSLETIYRRLYR